MKKSLKPRLNIYDLEANIFTEFFRGVKLGLTNLWRNKLLSLATILVMAIMVCIFNSILAVNYISKQALQNINQKVDLVFYLKEGTDYYNANLLAGKIKEIPGVLNVTYISKDQALNLISKTYPQTTDFLLKFNLPNPLPSSLSVTTESAEYHQAVYDYLKTSPYQDYIDNSFYNGATNQQEILASTSSNLISINNFVNQLIFWVVFIFIIGGALIVINAIQLTIFTRRNEIYIMRLVGATPNFIRLPFLTEGLFYAVISVSLSFLLLNLAGDFLGLQNLEIFHNFGSLNLTKVFLTELGISAILSLISSTVTVQQYLKNNLIFN